MKELRDRKDLTIHNDQSMRAIRVSDPSGSQVTTLRAGGNASLVPCLNEDLTGGERERESERARDRRERDNSPSTSLGRTLSVDGISCSLGRG